MLALIDYGFIIVFFVGLFVLVLVIARPRPEAVAAQGTVTSHIAASPGTKKISFALIAALFVLFLIVTVLSQREHAQDERLS